MNGTIEVVPNVAEAFADCVQNEFAQRRNDSFSLALSGGSVATSCYQSLSRRELDWNKIDVVWGDERCVPLDHPDSNYLLARMELLDLVGECRSVAPMSCTDGSKDDADAYDELIRSLSPIDFVHLGMGADGHTASLFPGSPLLDEQSDRFVAPAGDDLHKHPRLTFTYKAIESARFVVVTVAGESKREMLQRIRNGEDFPAGRVNAERVLWLVDDQAIGS